MAYAGKLVLVGTPIGNMGDLTPRAIEAFSQADVIVAEDTRRTRKLLSYAGVHGKSLVSYHPGNFDRRNREILELLHSGKIVAFVSDAGMPLISDPGEELVALAIEEAIEVDCVPGPSAILVALVLSGFPTRRFVFEGFVPRQESKRRAFLEAVAGESRTVVFYEAPHRLLRTLCDAAEVLGPERKIAVLRELTKLHQEAVRGNPYEVLEHFRNHKPRGEITVVVAPKSEGPKSERRQSQE
jgi:16S rRNA (cytidine1402-2'-O)-methyltransferase